MQIIVVVLMVLLISYNLQMLSLLMGARCFPLMVSATTNLRVAPKIMLRDLIVVVQMSFLISYTLMVARFVTVHMFPLISCPLMKARDLQPMLKQVSCCHRSWRLLQFAWTLHSWIW